MNDYDCRKVLAACERIIKDVEATREKKLEKAIQAHIEASKASVWRRLWGKPALTPDEARDRVSTSDGGVEWFIINCSGSHMLGIASSLQTIAQAKLSDNVQTIAIPNNEFVDIAPYYNGTEQPDTSA